MKMMRKKMIDTEDKNGPKNYKYSGGREAYYKNKSEKTIIGRIFNQLEQKKQNKTISP